MAFLIRSSITSAASLLFNKNHLLFSPPHHLPLRSTISFIRRATFNSHSVHVNPTHDHRVHDFFSDGGSGGEGKDWDAEENDESLKLRFDMPGLEKDDVKVSVVKHLELVIDAAKSKKKESEEEPIHYFTKIVMQSYVFNFAKIQAEMRNGVLKLVVPKMKPDEWEDVCEIEIE